MVCLTHKHLRLYLLLDHPHYTAAIAAIFCSSSTLILYISEERVDFDFGGTSLAPDSKTLRENRERQLQPQNHINRRKPLTSFINTLSSSYLLWDNS